MICFVEGCENGLGPESLEVRHKGKVTSFVCDNCVGTTKGFKLFVKKDDEGNYVLTDAIPINNPL